MRRALEDPDLLGGILEGATWRPWRIILIAAMGEKLTWLERRTFKRFTGRGCEPGKMVAELVAIAGRRGGKSRASSALACYLAALVDHSDVQAIGERLKVLFLAKDQKQAGICYGYVGGVFDTVPLFREMVINRTQDTISLNNGIDLEVKAASAAGVRGFSCVAVLADEAAHWTTDSASANADTLILDAVRPSLATTGGPLLILSSPFARRGEVWNLFDRHYGAKGDADVLVVHGASRDFNSSLPQSVVNRALARNPIAARAEWLAEFRSELEGYVSLDVLRSCTGTFTELGSVAVTEYVAGVDIASGSGEDSLALAICHHDATSDKVVVDYCREWTPPFSPSAVLTEVAEVCHRYGIETLIGDRYAFVFAREILRDRKLDFRVADKVTSQCFSELAPMLNASEVVLPQHQVLLSQLGALQRKPSSRGREFIGHPPGGHDDIAAAVAVAVTHCSVFEHRVEWSLIGLGGDEDLADYDDIRRRAFVRTGNVDHAGRPIEPTSNIPIVPKQTRFISSDNRCLH
jgi:hypothetical protein